MTKIRTLIAHDNNEITDKIVDTIKKLDFVDIVGIASNGTETYNKIIDIKPEMVFAKYSMENMNGMDIVKAFKEKLKNNIPIFNMIIDENVQENEIDELYNMIGKNLNSLISEPISDMVVDVISSYNDYKNNSEE